jgi:hypothetical protein
MPRKIESKRSKFAIHTHSLSGGPDGLIPELWRATFDSYYLTRSLDDPAWGHLLSSHRSILKMVGRSAVLSH